MAGGNLAAWSRAAGVNESTVRSFLDGTTSSMTDRTYAKLATHYGVPIAHLKGEPTVHGEPFKWTLTTQIIARKVPIIGYVGPGAEILHREHSSPLGRGGCSRRERACGGGGRPRR